MKKVFAFAAAVVLFAGMASAQLGINVGYAPQTYTTTNNSNSSNMELNGFFAGINYNVNLTGDLDLSVGLQYRMNSKSTTETLLGVDVTTSHSQSLIDIPVLFNYGLNLTDALKLSVFLGPTVSYALSGNTKVENSAVSALNVESEWYGDNSNQKQLDIAGTVGVCVSFDGIRLFGGYNMGLLNLTETDNTTLKGSNWFVGVGYAL